MLIERLVKIIMSGGLTLLCALIALGNILDPEPNLSFVRHVLSMDTIHARRLGSRRAMPIRRCGGSLLADRHRGGGRRRPLRLGTVELTNARSRRRGPFRRPSASSISARVRYPHLVVAATAVGGEWFAMWMSGTWNGQQAAFRIWVFILPVVIFVAEPEAELAARYREKSIRIGASLNVPPERCGSRTVAALGQGQFGSRPIRAAP